MIGAYNAVAPEHLTNIEFTQSLAKILKRPFWFPNIPSFVMKVLFGKRAEILLNGSRVSAEKVQKAGYRFMFPDSENALKQILQQKNSDK
jgi:NAD dependent epimerase/dehydratase family enzyme